MTQLKESKLPLLLNVDNFANNPRKPWAGDSISKKRRQYFGLDLAENDWVGEAWDFSTVSGKSSKLNEKDISGGDPLGITLRDYVEKFGEEVLGKNGASGNPSVQTCDIVIKHLTAKKALSVQLHPSEGFLQSARDQGDDTFKLYSLGADDAAGKPESWYILDAQPAENGEPPGIYLGFQKDWNFTNSEHLAEFRDLLGAGVDAEKVKAVMQFVPVEPGEYYDLAPGTLHAIGGGVTLLEPQLMVGGTDGITYRLYDWGSDRQLHIEQSMGVLRDVRPRQFGADFLGRVKRAFQPIELGRGKHVLDYGNNTFYHFFIICSTNASEIISLQLDNSYGTAICIGGQGGASSEGSEDWIPFQDSNCFFLPANANSFKFKGQFKMGVVIPAKSSYQAT